MAVVVLVENKDGKILKSSNEAVYYASQMDADCTALTFGNVDDSALAALGQFGASKVICNTAIDGHDNSQLALWVSQKADALGASIVVTAHDHGGKAVAPIVAAKRNAGIVSGVVALPDTSNGFVVNKAVFSGKAFAQFSVSSDNKVLTVLPNSLSVETTDGSASVEKVAEEAGASKVRFKEFRKKGTEGKLDLTEAEMVVSAGRGLKGPENWGMVEELAENLGAATACSRPVADIGWRPHHEHVGQTGIAIRPNLYIAIGISGAIQHLAGVNGSKVIVVINTDPEAPFFKAADYGIVGDAFEVVPKLVEATKNILA
ncbi:electron transfer flavoprotein subunit alpha/FixB family protein [bacterium SCSIO 12741]|nr:electron transfer flavoprotein subunit alpha/FixB family protein [bacterium SCSIO 12741]